MNYESQEHYDYEMGAQAEYEAEMQSQIDSDYYAHLDELINISNNNSKQQIMSTENAFLPSGYDVPKGNSSYLKFQDGENKFRILSAPILGWVDWKEKKPLRFPMDKKPAAPVDPTKPIKHFWAFVVWDYVAKKIAILEITQAGIMTAVKNLSEDTDWGAPFGYDIKVTKSGAGMETKYAINPVPHKPVHEMIADLYKKTPVNLQALFEGKDPFEAPVETTLVGAGASDDEDGGDLPF